MILPPHHSQIATFDPTQRGQRLRKSGQLSFSYRIIFFGAHQRLTPLACCARAVIGHVVEIAIALMKSRRRICLTHASGGLITSAF
jgi:hypothetical protein